MNELLALVISGGIFSLLGVLATLIFTRKKSQAETDLARQALKKAVEETERLNIENQNLRTEQVNAMMKQNNELLKAREELKAKLDISKQENLLLSQELNTRRIESVEKQKVIEDLLARQKKVEELLNTQHEDIVEMKKQTGQLPEQLPGAMKHE